MLRIVRPRWWGIVPVAVLGLFSLVSATSRTSAADGEAPADSASDELRAQALEANVTQGALRIVEARADRRDVKAGDGVPEKPEGFTVVECPLKHTDVQAEISGFLARVKVVQTFQNPLDRKIEAVYVFPLPHEAAVDAMTMIVGERRIVGTIQRRKDARAIYEQALLAGQTAALLEQQRPNIFTQSVGNIEPGQEVRIEISYVDVLEYDIGAYEFHFPMVVGPRYNPGGPIASPADIPKELAGKVAPPAADTDRVPDASQINPPVLKPEFRTGHDISLSIRLDAGVPIQDLTSANHSFKVARDGDRKAEIVLAKEDSLPNKDFVLRYKVVGEKPQMAVLAHTGRHSQDAARMGEGYFLLMIQPGEDERLTKSPPREIVFLVDVSGSMSGPPTAKVKEAMSQMLSLCREQDTVQVVTFASQANKLFDKPLPATQETIRRALAFTEGLEAGGGTEMIQGVRMAIDEPVDKDRVRIVVMLTDGYIGNEAEIIAHVGKNCGDKVRFWSIGIGASPNMFLIDGVAAQGGGMGKRLGLEDDATALTREIVTRIQRAQLAGIRIDWGSLEVSETFPARIPELWAGRPAMLLGRYRGSASSEVKVHGEVEGESVAWPIQVDLPAAAPAHDSLAKAWARGKIEHLMQQSHYLGSPAVEEEVTAIALDYRLMSQYTSFVAVDPTMPAVSPPADPPQRMLVPVPLPQGTVYEGFFGDGLDGDVEELLEFAESDRYSKGRLVESLAAQPQPRKKENSRDQLRSRRAASGPAIALGKQLSREGARGGMMAGGMGGFGGGAGMGMSGMGMPGMGMTAGGRPAEGRELARYYRFATPQRASASPTAGLQSQPARGLSPAPLGLHAEGLARNALMDVADERRVALGEAEYDTPLAATALTRQGAPIAEASQKALAQGVDQMKAKDWESALRSYQQAYLLSLAAQRSGQTSDVQSASAAWQGAHEAHEKLVSHYVERHPALATRLDLELVDLSIAQAMEKIASSANLRIKLLNGSETDSQKLTGQDSLRVTYLDLRGATAAEALDWVLLPARLSWRMREGGVEAGSIRRMDGVSAWVYDVAAMALPQQSELPDEGQGEKAVAAFAARLNDFLTAAKAQAKLEDPAAAVWSEPGKLLVVGDRAAHARLDKWLARLAAPDAAATRSRNRLQELVRKRLAERKPAIEKRRAAARQARLAIAIDQYSWPLLTAAADGRLDRQAISELSIAFRDGEMPALLAGDGRQLAFMSLWMICEASLALPEEEPLRELAASASASARPAAEAALSALKKQPDDEDAYSQVLFATLALRGDDSYRSAALPELVKKRNSDSPLASAVRLAKCLLEDPSPEDREWLRERLAEPASGDAWSALIAIACRRAGGETWEAYRASAADRFGDSPVRGDVVVLADRLAGSAPLVALARPGSSQRRSP